MQRRCQGNYEHPARRQGDKDPYSHVVWDLMYEVRRAELRQKGRDYVAEEDYALGDVGANEVEGGAQDYNVKDIVDETWVCQSEH